MEYLGTSGAPGHGTGRVHRRLADVAAAGASPARKVWSDLAGSRTQDRTKKGR